MKTFTQKARHFVAETLRHIHNGTHCRSLPNEFGGNCKMYCTHNVPVDQKSRDLVLRRYIALTIVVSCSDYQLVFLLFTRHKRNEILPYSNSPYEL